MEQNTLPLLWQPLSTVAVILVVMEMARWEGCREEEEEDAGPEGGSASGRGGGLSRVQGGEVGQLLGGEGA